MNKFVNRRDAVKKFLLIAGGIALAPSCLQNKNKSSLLLKNMVIDADQERLMAELAEAIIPNTDGPGAKDVAAHLFALKMIDDCFKKEDQQQFTRGMEAFNADCKKQTGHPFIDCPPEKKTAFLQTLEAMKEPVTDQKFFYSTAKRFTIQAYTTSKYFLTNISGYKLVPGRYYGCVPYKPA